MEINIIYEAEKLPEEGLGVSIASQNENSGTIMHERLVSCPFEQAVILARNLNETFRRMRMAS